MTEVNLMQGDCLVKMKEIPDGSVDMVLTDPPYGTTDCKWDSVIPFEPMWSSVWRVLKPNGACIMMASQPFTSALVMSEPKSFKYEWIWRKNIPSGFANASFMPMKSHESLLVFVRSGKPTFNKQETLSNIQDRAFGSKQTRIKGKHGVYGFLGNTKEYVINEKVSPRSVIEEIKCVPHASGTFHPTQKPVALMEYMILTYTNKGETVLDFTMGSGTTGVAAKKLDRKFIGIELDETYFNIAKARIDDVSKPSTLEDYFE